SRVSLERGALLSAVRVPQLERPVLAACGQGLAVRAEGHTGDAGRMSLEGRTFLSAVRSRAWSAGPRTSSRWPPARRAGSPPRPPRRRAAAGRPGPAGDHPRGRPPDGHGRPGRAAGRGPAAQRPSGGRLLRTGAAGVPLGGERPPADAAV